MTLRRAVLTGTAGLVMVVAATAVAGCGSQAASSLSTSPSATSGSSGSNGAAASSSSASASAAAPTGHASSAAVNPNATAAGGPPGCATRDLKATVGVAQGAAGSVYQVIDFTNIGTASCSLYGYPGIALAGGSPVTQIGMAASRSPQAGPALVTLKPGAVANTLLRITEAQNYPTSKCSPMASTYLQIYPPNQTTPIYLGYKSTGCSATGVNLLTVSVVQSGAGSGN
ncbi:MAG: DUF4232 domain-containing protein [Trebonia sp.]|jgi:hypothetical protein|uniref:DUF4232 domain-containing protein n=1 Tax=Trebonia sp. TaxID=2767075 RepID=UPI003CAA79A7